MYSSVTAICRLIKHDIADMSLPDVLAVAGVTQHTGDGTLNFALCPPLGKQPLVDLLTDLGGWELANISATSWNFSDLARDHLASGSALFGFSVSADAKFSSNQTIYVSKHCHWLVVYSPTYHALSACSVY